MNKFEVFLSPLAEFKLDHLLVKLESEWGSTAKANFIKELESAVLKIGVFPKSSPESELFGGIFKCVVTKQTTLYYRIHNKEIEILTITDNRQSPATIINEIKALR